MPRGRRTVPTGYTDLQGRVLQQRWEVMDTLGETLKDEHRKVREAGSADATDRQKKLLGYAHIAVLIYNGWQMGQITPVDFAQPSVYRAAFAAHPSCAVKARDAIIEAVKNGEVGEPAKYMKLLGEMGNPDGIDQEGLDDDGFLLLTLRAKYTLGAAVERINEVATDLSVALTALHVIDAQNRQVFVDLPWRAGYMRHVIKEYAPEMKGFATDLQDNWIAVTERMTDLLEAFEPLMISLYTKAMADYIERGPPRSGY
ncbi:MAG: hypothetical protein KGI26_04835 [Thaumarchaeota archaeon]|nr:hypothetical protein [Nitrososphaerota archaeon]